MAKAFSLPEPPQAHVTIDRRALNHIRDIAHRIFMERSVKDCNMLMFEALREYMLQKGAEPNFTVDLE